jgi:aspartyl-tRNA(Asn)/glutamyl-tRNA(Gln) amidotransferase subunit A
MAPTVACCAALDAIMVGEPVSVPDEIPGNHLRLLVVENVLLDDLDGPTAAAFDGALSLLSRAGAVVECRRLDSLDLLPEMTVNGGIVSAEAYAHHRRLMEARGDEYDSRVRVRIEPGARHSAADYLDLQQRRRKLRAGVDRETASFDAIVAPTTPMAAPPIADMSDEETYAKTNRLMLRSPSLANMLDRPSISIPCQTHGEAPVGLMLTGKHGADRHLFALAAMIERLLSHG